MLERGDMMQSIFCAENTSPYNYVDLFVTIGSFISHSPPLPVNIEGLLESLESTGSAGRHKWLHIHPTDQLDTLLRFILKVRCFSHALNVFELNDFQLRT